VSRRALLLTPSRGLGGGIERYAETLEWAFAAQGVEYQRVDLRSAGAAAHARLLAEARSALRAHPEPARLVLAHRCLLPAAALLSREPLVNGISVVCHGSDAWSAAHPVRRRVEDQLLGSDDVRVVAASSYTAGALAACCRAAILPPGLSGDWFRVLTGASSGGASQPGRGFQLLTAFRLADWQDKGLPQLLNAVAALGRPDVHVTVCGSGEPPAGLQELARSHRCVLHAGVSDSELARQLASSDLFVLATRTRPGRNPSGEGFGLVLLEAQVAGTPVVGPAHGGSHDAYIDGLTGVTPADESAGALARTLEELLTDTGRLARMGVRAAEWASEAFAPERYAARAVAALL
jgi:phosphatidyl-myo-inositol dimannoside synthase